MDEQSKQNVLDLPKVIAGGLASPVAALLTSHFGVAGTLVGLALSAVIVTVLTDILKVYLARAPGTVTSLPGGFTKKPGWRNILGRVRLPFSKFSSLASVRRRSILLGSVLAGGIAFLIGLSIVTGLELSAGKNLSCWLWKDCPTASSSGDKASSTLPSIFGARQATSSNVWRAWPSDPQQQPTPGVPVSPSPSPDVPGSETPTPSVPQPGQGQSPSGVPEAQQNQQQSPPEHQEDQQQSPIMYQEDQQQKSFRAQNLQPSPSGDSKDQQQEPPTPPAPQGYENW